MSLPTAARRRHRHSRDPVVNRSLRHSLRDGMAFAVMQGSGETYLAAFALFCKASAAQVALLSTLPALIGSIAQILGAWAAGRIVQRKPVIVAGATLQACMWLLIIAVPYFYPAQAIPLLLFLYTIYFAGLSLSAPPWISLMGDIVPERRRGRFFAQRTRLTSIVSFAALVAAGVLLHLFDERGITWGGFASIFLIACLARLVSVHHLHRMHEPPASSLPATLKVLSWKELRGLRASGALWFSLYFVLMQSAVAMAAPFFAVYMLRDLQFSYLQFMLNTGTAVFMQFVALNTWGRVSDAFGNRLILVVTGMTVPILPVLWVVTDDFWYLIAVQCLSGIAWAGFNLSTGNFIYDLVPQSQRAAYVAVHNVLTALGVFAGAMLSSLLIGFVPARTTWFGDLSLPSVLLNLFLISAAVRLLVGILLLERIPELRRQRRGMSPRHFVFRATRFSAFMGLLFEAVAALRPEDEKDA